MTPPLSTTPSAPTITRSTFSMMYPTAASKTTVTGTLRFLNASAIFFPAESGWDSVTYTVKRFFSAAAFSSTLSTTLEDECVRIFAPSFMKVWHSLATLFLEREIFFRKSSPLSTITFLHRDRSSCSRDVRLMKRRKSSPPEDTATEESTPVSRSMACVRFSLRPWMVSPLSLFKNSSRVRMAATAEATSGSCLI
uniref:Uncharacterized protein n=1 Tax=Anguilla anguilla TaxID=7936 RepID=A0A0E9XMW2_ANGAN